LPGQLPGRRWLGRRRRVGGVGAAGPAIGTGTGTAAAGPPLPP
jgi:hypothetical protein